MNIWLDVNIYCCDELGIVKLQHLVGPDDGETNRPLKKRFLGRFMTNRQVGDGGIGGDFNGVTGDLLHAGGKVTGMFKGIFPLVRYDESWFVIEGADTIQAAFEMFNDSFRIHCDREKKRIEEHQERERRKVKMVQA